MPDTAGAKSQKVNLFISLLKTFKKKKRKNTLIGLKLNKFSFLCLQSQTKREKILYSLGVLVPDGCSPGEYAIPFPVPLCVDGTEARSPGKIEYKIIFYCYNVPFKQLLELLALQLHVRLVFNDKSDCM